MARPIQLTVLPNPWHSTDHEGRPAGPCPRERPMSMAGGHQGHVGAMRVASTPVKLPDGHQGTPDQDTCWHFSREPRAYEDPHNYYLRALKSGEIFPADAKTARLAGIEFKPYDEYLREARAEAARKWFAVTGEQLPDVDPFAPPTPGVYARDRVGQSDPPVTSAQPVVLEQESHVQPKARKDK